MYEQTHWRAEICGELLIVREVHLQSLYSSPFRPVVRVIKSGWYIGTARSE